MEEIMLKTEYVQEMTHVEETSEEWESSNVRKLISIIKENPILYNKFMPEFLNKRKKAETWMAIANFMGMPEIQVQKRWKSLRVVFARNLLAKRTVGRKRAADWEYWHDMKFLLQFVRNRKLLPKLPKILRVTSGHAAAAQFRRSANLNTNVNPNPSTNSPSASFAAHGMSIDGPQNHFPLLSTNVSQAQPTMVSSAATATSASTSYCVPQPLPERYLIVPDMQSQDGAQPQNQQMSVENRKSTIPSTDLPSTRPTGFETHEVVEVDMGVAEELSVPPAAQVAEVAQSRKPATAVAEPPRESSRDEALSYLTCLVPGFRLVPDRKKSECLKRMLEVLISYGPSSDGD